jgi:hypothetical protein
MPNPNSVIRKAHFRQIQLPVVAGTIKMYKGLGYKIVDGIESVLIEEPQSTFRVFISRISHVLQFYYLGEGEFTKEFSTKDLDSAAQVAQEERKYKELFG